jgi:hypothetical protein
MKATHSLLRMLTVSAISISSICHAGEPTRPDVLQIISKTCGVKPGHLSWDKNGSARLNGVGISYKRATCVFRELDKNHIRYPKAYVGKIG